MKLIIDRTKWLRSEGWTQSYLLRGEDRKMCCLGFYSLACGLSESNINYKAAPSDVDYGLYENTHGMWLFNPDGTQSEACKDLMDINDNSADELSISEIFSKHGVEVEFIN